MKLAVSTHRLTDIPATSASASICGAVNLGTRDAVVSAHAETMSLFNVLRAHIRELLPATLPLSCGQLPLEARIPAQHAAGLGIRSRSHYRAAAR